MYLKRRPAEKWGPPLSTLVCLEWLLIGHACLNDLVSVWKSELSRTHCCFQSGDRYTWKCLKVGSYSFPCICNSLTPATSPAYMTSVTTKFPSLSKVYPQRQSGVMRVELALYCQHASTCSVEHRVHAHTHTHTDALWRSECQSCHWGQWGDVRYLDRAEVLTDTQTLQSLTVCPCPLEWPRECMCVWWACVCPLAVVCFWY